MSGRETVVQADDVVGGEALGEGGEGGGVVLFVAEKRTTGEVDEEVGDGVLIRWLRQRELDTAARLVRGLRWGECEREYVLDRDGPIATTSHRDALARAHGGAIPSRRQYATRSPQPYFRSSTGRASPDHAIGAPATRSGISGVRETSRAAKHSRRRREMR